MSWVRIDDSAVDHPKILKLTDSQFRLWVKGLCYCQKHLTDGYVPSEALKPMQARAGDAARLCEVSLWEEAPGGFQVHDFLQWNDSRERVTERREAAGVEKVAHRRRMQDWRDKKKTKRDSTCDTSHIVTRDTPQRRYEDIPVARQSDVTVTLLTTPHQTLVQKDPTASSLSAPPPTHGKQHGRIFVHPWQLHELIDTLGPHAQTFGLDEWVFGLSTVADSKGLVLEKKAVWPWVQQQLSEEIRRRGLPVAGSEPSADDTLQRIRDEIERQNAMVRRA